MPQVCNPKIKLYDFSQLTILNLYRTSLWAAYGNICGSRKGYGLILTLFKIQIKIKWLSACLTKIETGMELHSKILRLRQREEYSHHHTLMVVWHTSVDILNPGVQHAAGAI